MVNSVTGKMISRVLSFLFVVFIGFHYVDSQEVSAIASVDSNSISLGGAVGLHIKVQHPAGVTVRWPALADSLAGLEIVQKRDSSVHTSGSTTTESVSYTITGFEPGTFYIPPLPFTYTVANDTSVRTVMTRPIPLTVMKVQVDTTKDIRDIKPPLSIPITFWELLPYILIVGGVIGVVFLIYYILKKRKMGESLLPEAPPRPAHEVALEALRALGSENLWQRGKVKEYYSQLTDIVRTYIERRFRVMAMEMTTDEILDDLRQTTVSHEDAASLKEVLVRADLVKFAKFQPGPQEHEASLSSASRFVESTWREQTQPESAAVTSEESSRTA